MDPKDVDNAGQGGQNHQYLWGIYPSFASALLDRHSGEAPCAGRKLTCGTTAQRMRAQRTRSDSGGSRQRLTCVQLLFGVTRP